MVTKQQRDEMRAFVRTARQLDAPDSLALLDALDEMERERDLWARECRHAVLEGRRAIEAREALRDDLHRTRGDGA